MTTKLREQTRLRALGRCEYCRLPDWLELAGPFHIEHVVARQHRGGDDFQNLAWACSCCNCYKGTNLSAIDPDTNFVVGMFNPRFEDWDLHFELVGVRIVGKTGTGRATVWLLQMNSERRSELRAQLIKMGLWKPTTN